LLEKPADCAQNRAPIAGTPVALQTAITNFGGGHVMVGRIGVGAGVGVVVLGVAIGLGGLVKANSGSAVRGAAVATKGMRPLAGQQAACSGPKAKTFALEVQEKTVDVGMNISVAAWTFNGTLPGPTIEVCEGDEVTITVANHGTALHGLDSHALRTGTAHFGPVAPSAELTMRKVVDTPGVFMYHCAAAGMTDVHVKRGMTGAMIVYPRKETLRPAVDLVVVQSALFGQPDANGFIDGAGAGLAMLKNDPSFMMYNGRLSHDMIGVEAGDLVRLYFVNVGPGTAAVHVMGTILDRVIDGGNEIEDVQTYGIPAGSGAIVEFRIPEEGTFGLVDHDRLGYLPMGLMLGFTTTPEDAHAGHAM
jgi:nitrite reductase (NO-forming)